MDETGLYWRKAPTTMLATETQLSVKQNKSRITVHMCSNAAGSDKVGFRSLFLCFLGLIEVIRWTYNLVIIRIH